MTYDEWMVYLVAILNFVSFSYLIKSCARQFTFSLAGYSAFLLAAEGAYAQAITAVERKLRDPQVAYIIEAQNKPLSGGPEPIILHGFELDPQDDELPENAVNAVVLETDEESLAKSRTCSYFFSETRDISSSNSAEVICLSFDIRCTDHLEFDDLIFVNIY